MKKDTDGRIELLPEKKKRSLGGIPAGLYRGGWVMIAVALLCLLAVWLLLRGQGISAP
ncbi:MAG: hypothetical protein K2I56_00895 [Muribaculaceae bacterium]|nr:hypothetical protein [Muribaculaceae bacterium]